jgi:hypothetical protein
MTQRSHSAELSLAQLAGFAPSGMFSGGSAAAGRGASPNASAHSSAAAAAWATGDLLDAAIRLIRALLP